MSVSADGYLLALLNLSFDHGGLVVNNVLDCQDDLENMLPVDLLAILESLDHVINVFLSHLVSQLGAIVAVLNDHAVQVQTLRGRRGIGDLDSLEEGIALDKLLTCVALSLGNLVTGTLLHYNFPVVDSVGMSQDGSVGNSSSVVCLDLALARHVRGACSRASP